MFEFSLPSGVEKRSSFSLMTDTVANSLSEFKMLTPQSGLTHKVKRRVLQDSTNVTPMADTTGLVDPLSMKENLVAVDSTRKPKRLRKDKAGSFSFAGGLAPTSNNKHEGGKEVTPASAKPSKPPQYSSALSRLSQTIDQGVSECMDCLSELKTKNTKYEYLLKTIKDEIKGIRDHAKTPQDGAAANAGGGNASGKNNHRGSADSLVREKGESSSARGSHQTAMKLTPSVCQNLNMSVSPSPALAIAPASASKHSNALTPDFNSVERMVTPCNVGQDEIKHSFQLACAQNLIGESIAAIGSGEKQGAKERVGLAIEALRSVMSEWKECEENARENNTTRTPPLGDGEIVTTPLIESISGSQRKQMVVQFCSPTTERSEPQSTSRKEEEEKVEQASEGAARVERTPEENLPSQNKKQMSAKSGTPKILNIEDVFAKAWAGASPLFQTPLPALTPLPVSTQILQGFTFPTLTTVKKENRSEQQQNEEETEDVKRHGKEKCVVM